MNYTYKDKNIEDLLSRSHELENKSLAELGFVKSKNKGLAGLISERWFGLPQNNSPMADFEDVGLELKTTPIKKLKNGLYSAKERLVLKMIDFNDAEKPFKESFLYKKIKNILVINYEIENYDTFFRKGFLLNLAEDQMRIIEDDYNFIINKIKSGKAHELSESQTTYLGACRKGHKEGPRKYKYSQTPAKSRAWSFKTTLMTQICRNIYNDMKMLVHRYSEDSIINKLITHDKKLIGKTSLEIRGKDNSKDKSKNANAIKSAHKGLNFIKDYDLSIKCLTIKDNKSQESLSFKQIDFNELIVEDWENTELYNFMTNPILIYMFNKDGNKLIDIRQIKFEDYEIEDAKKSFELQKERIKKGNYSFLKASDDLTIHVRPKGKNKQDTVKLPGGAEVTKQCWWINKSVINKKLA